MNFFLDHDVPERIADVLHLERHNVVRLREALPVETLDSAIFDHARRHSTILVTCNQDDFLPLAPAQPNPGLIALIRHPSRLAE